VKKAASKSLFLNKKKNGFLRKREIFNFLRNEKTGTIIVPVSMILLNAI
jgi:hypothetical protein